MRWLALALSAVLLVGCAESNLVRGTTTDRTPPTVTATEPANEAQNVTDGRITITFSEPMATNTVQVRANPSLTLGVATWSNANRTVTFVPSDLRPNTTYTVTVMGRDLAGNNLQQPYTFRFTTGSVVQSGAVIEGALRGRVFAGADERVYAVFLAYLAGLGERAAATLTEDQRTLRETLERTAPEAVRKVREFLGQHPATVRDLAEYALWLTPDLRVAPVPQPVQGSTRAAPASPGPAPASPTPMASPSSRANMRGASAGPGAPAAQATPSPAAGQTRGAVVQRLSGFDAVVRELYAEAKGQELWARAREAHEREAAQLRDGVEDRLRQAATYLRINSLPFARLVLVPNLLAPRDSLAEVQLGEVLHVFTGPSTGPNVRGVVRVFLRSVVAPLVAQYREAALQSRELYDLVKQEAEARGWEDWEAVVRESLVRAVEARIFLPNPQEQSDYLETTFNEGLVLVRHFAQRLVDLERGQVNLPRFVEDSLRNVNVPQVRQQWQGRRR